MEKFTSWAVELQSLAQDGLEYGHDRFDFERYERIRAIATEMMTAKTGLPVEQVHELFSSEDGYQTPKLGTRAAIFKNGQILLVRETTDDHWSMPGGWCEPNISVKENCIKEAKEESGRDVKVERVIAICNHQTAIHNNKRVARPINVCTIFFLCHENGGNFTQNSETSDCQYFDLNHLPKLSLKRNSVAEIEMCFAAQANPNWQTKFE